MRKRLEAVMNVPAPYRQHLFNELWRQLDARGIDFHVHYMARGFKARPDSWMNPQIDFPHTYWKNYGTSEHQFNPGMIAHLISHQPDWLICGSSFYTPTGIAVMNACTRSTKIAWVEGNSKTTGEMHGIKGWVKRWVLSKCKHVAVPGVDGARYISLHQEMTKRKMPRVVYLPNLVDESKFMPRNAYAEDEIEDIRHNLGVSDTEKLIVTPARMVVDKGLVPYLSLLDTNMLQGWKQVIVGSGPLFDEVKNVISARGLIGFIKTIESLPYSEMPKYYAAADLFLLPSVHDQNPLSVVEALHSGLPIALTLQAGNVEEAVTDGKNGWVLPVMDEAKFKAKLKEVLSANKSTLQKMGEVSKSENSRFWNTKESIARFVENVVGC